MKRYTIAVLLTLFLLVNGVPVVNAVFTPGSKCSKAGMEKTDNGKVYTCIKSGNKLVWSKGSNVPGYTAFADALLSEARKNSAQIISEAKSGVYQMSNPPNCTTGGSRAVASIGTDQFGLSALVFENSGICELVVRASASFICPDGGTTKLYNSITSSGTFTLRAGEKLFVSVNVAYYFPQVLTDCRLLTGYATNIVSLNPLQYPPSVIVLSSNYSGVFNRVEAIKKANQFLASEKARADKIIADAKNPTLIAQAWDAAVKAKNAADADALARRKAATDAKAAAAAKADADALAVIECAKSGRSCKVGNTGPGGGIVFYDAGSQQSWGRYLEFAPLGWFGGTSDPKASWCDSSVTFKTQVEIGTGKTNTDLMVGGCISGAAVMARTYKASGKDDWSLPSKDELTMLCKYWQGQETNYQGGCGGLRPLGGFNLDPYWSSTEFAFGSAYAQFIGFSNPFGNYKERAWHVRPVRAF